MKVQVRLGSGLSRLAGSSQFALELERGATVGDLLTNLEHRYPSLAAGIDRALPVVAGSHVAHDRALEDGEEIALLFPAAGG